MSLSIEDKKKMIQARKLIKLKKYKEAYSTIERIQHPTALEWRNRLKIYIDEQEFEDLFEQELMTPNQYINNDNTTKNRKRTYLGIGVVIVTVLLLLAIPIFNSLIEDEFRRIISPDPTSTPSYNGNQWMQWNDQNGNYYLATYEILNYSPTGQSRHIGGHNLDMTSFVIHCRSGEYDLSIISATKAGIETDTYKSSFNYDFYRKDYDTYLELDEDGDLIVVGLDSLPRYLEDKMTQYFNEMSQSKSLVFYVPLLSIYEDMPTLGFDIRGFDIVIKPLIENCGPLPS